MTLQSPSSTLCAQFLAALDAATPPENVAAAWHAHLLECENCRLELEARTKMMNRLRQAHQNAPPPPYLESRIRAAIAADAPRFPAAVPVGFPALGLVRRGDGPRRRWLRHRL